MVHIWGLNVDEISKAFEKTNTVFSDNIALKRFEKYGKGYIVTLTVVNSRAHGSRISCSGRRICAACWHVYGVFFDECFKINKHVKIKQHDQIVTPENNWTDFNIGSLMYPLMYSKACDCEKHGLVDKLRYLYGVH